VLEADKASLLEKPMTTDVEQARRLRDKAVGIGRNADGRPRASSTRRSM
jgi:predicted dehydrogenase